MRLKRFSIDLNCRSLLRIFSEVVDSRMAKLAGGQELRVKVTTDETFGPIILLGQGGSEWDESIDAAAAFPPLNT
ncbi:acetate--CoA ligase family protein [Vibrio lentus]|nr:acetate--CoA ligase family protein [Vibrio lentus]